MNAYDFVQLAMYAFGGEIKGKTKLQKIIYFLGLWLGREKELGYRPHFYGPYSDEVAAAVERLKSLGFVDQNVSGVGASDSRGFEVARYDYRLNESGRKMAEAKATQAGDQWNELRKASEALKQLLDQDYMKLSIAAKTWYMLGEKKGQASLNDLTTLAPKFGWSVNAEQLKDAVKLLADVNLVTLAENTN